MDYYSDENNESDDFSDEDEGEDEDDYYDCISDMKCYLQYESDSDFNFFWMLSTDRIIDIINSYEYKRFTMSMNVENDKLLMDELLTLVDTVLGQGQKVIFESRDLNSLYNQLKYEV